MRTCCSAVHCIKMSHDPSAIAVGMIPVSFFCNKERAALSRPAGLTGIIFGIVSVTATVHLLRGDRADLRIEVDAVRVCVIALPVFRDIYPVSASSPAASISAAPLCPAYPGVSAVPRLHRETGEGEDPYEGPDPAADDDIYAVSFRHDPGSGYRQPGASSLYTGMAPEGLPQIGGHFVPHICLGQDK